MMKTALLLLSIYAMSDFLMGFGGAIGTAMLATENGAFPSWSAVIAAAVTGMMASLRTLMPILKSMLQEYGIKVNGADTSAVVKAAAKT
jgi:hypothetical protein